MVCLFYKPQDSIKAFDIPVEKRHGAELTVVDAAAAYSYVSLLGAVAESRLKLTCRDFYFILYHCHTRVASLYPQRGALVYGQPNSVTA
ncbi:Uncharacterised protein [uncultured archaeon]|nr:Uncharacterised protein [uncultured archaeon]